MSKYGAFDVAFGLDHLLGPSYRMQKSLESLHEALMPSSMMVDMQERLRPFDIDRMMGLPHLHGLGANFEAHDRITASMRAVTQLMRGQEFVSGFGMGPSITEHLRSMLGPQLAWSASPTFHLAESLGSLMPQPLQLEWQEHLVKSLAPSFDLLAADASRPVGLLAFMEAPQLGASLSWLTESTTRPAIAALVPEAPRLAKVTIDVVVVCAFCGEQLVDQEQTLRWKGNRRRLEIGVIPICATCLSRAQEDADYVVNSVDALLRPKLRLVSRDGNSDGVARGKGKLRLVTWAEDDDALDVEARGGDEEDNLE